MEQDATAGRCFALLLISSSEKNTCDSCVQAGGRQTERQTDRQTHGRTDRPTDRETERDRKRQTQRQTQRVEYMCVRVCVCLVFSAANAFSNVLLYYYYRYASTEETPS